MKVDTIITGFGDIEVEYSTFTKGFFIKKYPEKLEQVKGLKLLKSRDSSFTEFKKLQDYVKDLVHNAMIDFKFERKVIIYKIDIDKYRDGLSFEYLVCDESVKSQRYCGEENACETHTLLFEYYLQPRMGRSQENSQTFPKEAVTSYTGSRDGEGVSRQAILYQM